MDSVEDRSESLRMIRDSAAGIAPRTGDFRRIRALRFFNGEMTQAELGLRIGVTRQTIAAIEAGQYAPSLAAAFRIAQVFKVPLEEVFQWDGQDSR